MKKLDILSVDCDWIVSLKQQEELLSFVIPLLYTHSDITTSLIHTDIYPLVKHGYDEYNIINIDQHHDWRYKEASDNKLHEGNWVFHLSNIFKKKINYLWICNPHSWHMYINGLYNLKSYNFDHHINSIKQKKFDKIFICCSPDYTQTELAITAYKILESIVNENKKSNT
jgi:hypothetical protein|tara:strand:- start:26 stop:535 length:510 start_codon:yes stop_codon:yes gene_type:complete